MCELVVILGCIKLLSKRIVASSFGSDEATRIAVEQSTGL
jgi:hypothetical protein